MVARRVIALEAVDGLKRGFERGSEGEGSVFLEHAGEHALGEVRLAAVMACKEVLDVRHLPEGRVPFVSEQPGRTLAIATVRGVLDHECDTVAGADIEESRATGDDAVSSVYLLAVNLGEVRDSHLVLAALAHGRGTSTGLAFGRRCEAHDGEGAAGRSRDDGDEVTGDHTLEELSILQTSSRMLSEGPPPEVRYDRYDLRSRPRGPCIEGVYVCVCVCFRVTLVGADFTSL